MKKNRVMAALAALVPWLWIIVGLLYVPRAYHDLYAEHWFFGALNALFCIACVLLGTAQLAERRISAERPEVHP